MVQQGESIPLLSDLNGFSEMWSLAVGLEDAWSLAVGRRPNIDSQRSTETLRSLLPSFKKTS